MEQLNHCFECEQEWYENDATYCPYCLSGDFVVFENEEESNNGIMGRNTR